MKARRIEKILIVFLMSVLMVMVVNDSSDAAVSMNVVANVKNQKNVSLSWNKQSGVSKYYIYRAVNKNGKAGKSKKIAEVAGTKKTYSDSTVKANTEYTYVVKAYKISGGKKKLVNSSRTVVYTGILNVYAYVEDRDWKVSGSVLNGYFESVGDLKPTGIEIYRKEGKGNYKKMATVNSFAKVDGGYAVGFCDLAMKSGNTYKYKARAYWKDNGKKKYTKFSKERKVTAVNTEPCINTSMYSEKSETANEVIVCVESSSVYNGKLSLRMNMYNKEGDIQYKKTNSTYFDGYLSRSERVTEFMSNGIYTGVLLKEYSYDNNTWKKYTKDKAIVIKPGQRIYLKYEGKNNQLLNTSADDTNCFSFLLDYNSSFSKQLYEVYHYIGSEGTGTMKQPYNY